MLVAIRRVIADLKTLPRQFWLLAAGTFVYLIGVGPLLGGWALDALGGRLAFAVVAVACLAGAALFPLLRGSVRDRMDKVAELEEARGRELRGERPEQAV